MQPKYRYDSLKTHRIDDMEWGFGDFHRNSFKIYKENIEF